MLSNAFVVVIVLLVLIIVFLIYRLFVKSALLIEYKIQLQEQALRYEERIKFHEESKNELKKEFGYLANEALIKNSKEFSSLNQESINRLLEPFKKQIDEFKKRVEDVYDKESKDRTMLYAQITALKELNIQISNDALNLTNALKGESKTQGVWGEMVLEKVLEASGLRLGLEYEREVSLKNDENQSYRPDVIVHLPQNRDIIIDSKTSLRAYEEYISAEDDVSKKQFLTKHIASIKEHIKILSSKNYDELIGVNSLDFIFMFVPIESALILATQNDLTLFDEAFKKHIVLVSPTTLLVALRAIENSWRYEKQSKNIAEVTNKVEKIYSKFVGFVKNMEDIGKNIKKADESYEKAFAQLHTGNGNIIRQMSELKAKANITTKTELDSNLLERATLDIDD